MKLPLTGACQCRSVRYEIRAEPITVYACHCTECQRQSGSAFGLSMVVPRESVVITAGKPKEWLRTHESGRIVSCMFCDNCGSRLYHNPKSNEAVTIVKYGTLDGAADFPPVGHIWTRSAQKWFPLPADSVCYEQQQPEMSRLVEAWKKVSGG